MSKKFYYFFDPETRWKAWLLLTASILTTIAFIGFLAWMNWWNPIFWEALSTMNMPLFIEQLWVFAGIVTGAAASWYLFNVATNELSNDWRQSMTASFLDDYLPDEDVFLETAEKNDFVDISRSPDQLETPAQRIQEDVKGYVDGFLSLTMGLVRSVLQLSTSIVGLWIIGGALSFVMFGTLITIPGYLVWTAILFSSLASGITRWIAGDLNELTTMQKNKESELRRELQVLHEQGEFIAQESGREYYRNALNQKMAEVTEVNRNIGQLNAKTNVFQNIYTNLAMIFPILIASPLYFSGFFPLGMFFQVSILFGQVNSALDLFVNSYKNYYDFINASERLDKLESAFLPDGLNTAPKHIQRQRLENNQEIKLEAVQVTLPHQDSVMIGPLNLTIGEKQRVLISGDNGTGKSTLFKVIQGSWRYGEGRVSAPRDMMFFSQKPTMPHRTLRAVLAYPYEPERYETDDYRQALIKVGLEGYTMSLDDPKQLNWSSKLSGGEQQQVGFARILLHKPKWIGLDEATAALTETNEHKMYDLVINELPESTIVSIGHRQGIRSFHNRHLFFSKPTEKGAAVLTHDGALFTDVNAVNDRAYNDDRNLTTNDK